MLSTFLIDKISNREKLHFECSRLGTLNLSYGNNESYDSDSDMELPLSYFQEKIKRFRESINARSPSPDFLNDSQEDVFNMTRPTTKEQESKRMDKDGIQTKGPNSTNVKDRLSVYSGVKEDSRMSTFCKRNKITVDELDPPLNSRPKTPGSLIRLPFKQQEMNSSLRIKTEPYDTYYTSTTSDRFQQTLKNERIQSRDNTDRFDTSAELTGRGAVSLHFTLDTSEDMDTVVYEEKQTRNNLEDGQLASKDSPTKSPLEPISEQKESVLRLPPVSSSIKDISPSNMIKQSQKIDSSDKIDLGSKSRTLYLPSSNKLNLEKEPEIEKEKDQKETIDPIDELKRSINNYRGYKEYNQEKYFKTGVDLLLRGKFASTNLNPVSLLKFDAEKHFEREEKKKRELTKEGRRNQLVGRKIRLYELKMLQKTGRKIPKEISEQMNRQYNTIVNELSTYPPPQNPYFF